MEVATWGGWYGNQESQVVLTIPPARITSAEYVRPSGTRQEFPVPGMMVTQPWSFPGYCTVRYLGESGEERALLFAAVDHWELIFSFPRERPNLYTDVAADALLALRGEESDPPFLPPLSLEPARAFRRRAFTIAALIVALLFAVALVTDRVLLRITGVLWLLLTLALLAGNLVKVQTDWPPNVKGLAITGIFVLSTVLSVIVSLVMVIWEFG